VADEEGGPVPGDELVPGPAATTVVSLSQLLLAPLDAIFKAQVHAARSFLSLVLQLAYPPTAAKDPAAGATVGDVYLQEFQYPTRVDGQVVKQKVQIPALALIPVNPLSVQEATFSLRMTVSHISSHRQTRASARAAEPGKRKWFLVDDPISIRGVVAPATPAPAGAEESQGSTIEISVKVGAVAVPAGLDKLLTAMTQRVTVEPGDQPPARTPDH